jgi:hypothetical protein
VLGKAPNMAVFSQLFDSPAITCAAWTHLLCLDFYVAR